MKKLIFLSLLSLIIASCELDNGVDMQYVVGPIQEVEMPATYRVDSISDIMIQYARPDNCHIFNGFYYDAEGDTRNVAITYAKMNRDDCEVEADPVFEVPLHFRPLHSGTYHFKFWTGTDDQGVDTFYEVDAVVPD